VPQISNTPVDLGLFQMRHISGQLGRQTHSQGTSAAKNYARSRLAAPHAHINGTIAAKPFDSDNVKEGRAMQHTIMLGSPVRCVDGKAGIIGGLLVNPNRNHVDYVILRSDASDGNEYFVPSGQIQRASARELSIPCSWGELENLPHPERQAKQGTVLSNLSDLVIVRERTIVRDSVGEQIGIFHGAIVDSDLEIQAVLLSEAPDRAIPITQLARHSDGASDLVVHLAQQGLEHEAVPIG
jgi:hypothetical protein